MGRCMAWKSNESLGLRTMDRQHNVVSEESLLAQNSLTVSAGRLPISVRGGLSWILIVHAYTHEWLNLRPNDRGFSCSQHPICTPLLQKASAITLQALFSHICDMWPSLEREQILHTEFEILCSLPAVFLFHRMEHGQYGEFILTIKTMKAPRSTYNKMNRCLSNGVMQCCLQGAEELLNERKHTHPFQPMNPHQGQWSTQCA